MFVMFVFMFLIVTFFFCCVGIFIISLCMYRVLDTDIEIEMLYVVFVYFPVQKCPTIKCNPTLVVYANF